MIRMVLGFLNAAMELVESYVSLHEAARKGRTKVVRFLVRRGGPNRCTRLHGFTPLLGAAEEGHVDVVRILLDAGAAVNATNGNDETPPSLGRRVRSHGSRATPLGRPDPNRRSGKDSQTLEIPRDHDTATTPLVEATVRDDEESVRLLLASGAQTDTRVRFPLAVNSGADTNALSEAAKCGHVGIVRLLLGAGTDVQAKGSHGVPPLNEAASRGFDEIVRLLLEHESPEIAGEWYSLSPIFVGSAQRDIEMIRDLFDDGESVTELRRKLVTVLVAATPGRMDVVRACLETLHFIPDLDVPTAISRAFRGVGNDERNSVLVVAVEVGAPGVVDALIGLGADPKTGDLLIEASRQG